MSRAFLEVRMKDGEVEINLRKNGKVEMRLFDYVGYGKAYIEMSEQEIRELIEALERVEL